MNTLTLSPSFVSMNDPTLPPPTLATFLHDEHCDRNTQSLVTEAAVADTNSEPIADNAAAVDDAVIAEFSTQAHVGNAAAPAPTPAFMRRARPRTRASAWQWALLIALALVLIVQILLADRARLSADARWRPLLTQLCNVLDCQLPAWRQPEAFSMLARSVRPDSSQPGVLEVQASFRNDARWNQAWPILQLTLSDADGRMIGSRDFLPRDYLGHAIATDAVLAPGQATEVAFRIHEPASGTEAFTFEFR